MRLLVVCVALLPFVLAGMEKHWIDDVNIADMYKEVVSEEDAGPPADPSARPADGGDGGDGGKGGDGGEEEDKNMMDDFKDYLAKQHAQYGEDTKEKVESKIVDFKEYLKRQAVADEMKKRAEEEHEKKEKREWMKEELGKELEEAAHELKEAKGHFKFAVMEQFVGLCKCEPSFNGVEILKRVEEGEFGAWENNTVMAAPVSNVTVQRIDGVDIPSVMDDLRYFFEKDAADAYEHALGTMVDILCASAQGFIETLSLLEPVVVEARQNITMMNGGNQTQINGTNTFP